MQRSIYDAAETGINQAQYAQSPFQRIEIDLTVDRSGGENIPGIEGTGLYVECSDYPALLAFAGLASAIQQTMYAKDGAKFRGAFKGLSIAHPKLTGVNANWKPRLVFYVIKGSADFDLSLSTTATRFHPPARIVSNTALSLIYGVPIPPGTRRIEKVDISVSGTTVTSAFWGLNTYFAQNYQGAFNSGFKYGSFWGTPSPAWITGSVNYDQGLTLGGYFAQVPCAGGFLYRGENIVLPYEAQEFLVSIAGTGLALNLNFAWSLD